LRKNIFLGGGGGAFNAPFVILLLCGPALVLEAGEMGLGPLAFALCERAWLFEMPGGLK
jgi:hypothetical protein